MVLKQEESEAVQVLRLFLAERNQDWVLFENGTFVVVPQGEEAKATAIEILREYGPVYPGSSAGDFNVTKLNPSGLGCIITSHHGDVSTYVTRSELVQAGIQMGPFPDALTSVTESSDSFEGMDMFIGLFGRNKRNKDGKELNPVHIESKIVP